MPAPDKPLLERIETALRDAPLPGGAALHRGITWTTDAPYRETDAAIAAARAQGVLAVEMEAAALYAFGTARRAAVVCFALVTNTMGQQTGDFEKGEAEGSLLALRIVAAAAGDFSSGLAAPAFHRLWKEQISQVLRPALQQAGIGHEPSELLHVRRL